MKNSAIFITVLIFSGIAAGGEQIDKNDYAPYPMPDRGYVTDLAGLLTDEQEERLEGWLYTTEKENGVEIVVVTIFSIADYPGTANGSVESFATGLFNKYGIGNLPANNGVLLVVAVKDRKARIELGSSYGRNRDRDANRIMQNKIVPQFKQDRYDEGIIDGTRAIVAEFGHIRILPGWPKLAIIIAIAVLIPVTISLFRSGKRGWGWIFVGIIIILLLFFFNLTRRTIEALPESGSSGGGIGGFGGGFGGGSSGGGGATGSW